MKRTQWLSSIKQSLIVKKSRKSRRRFRSQSPTFEKLEHRNLLATVAFDSATGSLIFNSDAGQQDDVTVESLSATSIQIQVANGDSIAIPQNLLVSPAFQLSTAATTNDTLTIDTSTAPISVLTFALGDLDDTLTAINLTSGQSLLVFGGTGDDTVTGGSGDDTIIGGDGADNLTGGAGDDFIVGGLGNDTLFGGLGDDTLDGSAGTDLPDAPVIPVNDLVTVKTLTSGDDTPNVGDTVTFQIEVTNNGPSNSTSVSLVDLLPAGLTPTINNGIASVGTYEGNETGFWDIGDLASGASAILTLEGTVDIGQSGSTITNVTTPAAAAGEIDPTTEGDDLAESILVNEEVDLITTLTGGGTFSDLEAINLVVTVFNNGPDTATNVTQTALLPPELIGIEGTGATSVGTYDSVTGLWDIGDLAVGESATLTLVGISSSQFDVGDGTTFDVTVSAATGDQVDPDITSDDLSQTIDIEGTQLVIVDFFADLITVNTLTSGDSTPDVGDTVTFQIVVTNNFSDFGGTRFILTDLLPAGLSPTANNGSVTTGTYDPLTGEWEGFLADGASATLILEGIVDSDQAGNTITNTTTAAVPDEIDPTTDGDVLTASINIEETFFPTIIDLVTTVSLDSGSLTPNVNDTLVFSVVITNAGGGPGADVIGSITGNIPSGLTPTGNNTVPAGTTYDPSTQVWDYGSLLQGDSVTLLLEVMVDSDQSGNPLTYSTTAADDADADTSTDDLVETIVVNTLSEADLVTTLTGGGTFLDADTISVVVTVFNNGPGTATNVTQNAFLPSELSPLATNGTTSVGTYDDTTGLWSIGDLASGASAILTLVGVSASQFDIGFGTTFDAMISEATGDQVDPDITTDILTQTININGTINNPQPGEAGLAKSANVAFTNNPDGTRDIDVILSVENVGPQGLANFALFDDFAGLLDPATLLPVFATPPAIVNSSATMDPVINSAFFTDPSASIISDGFLTFGESFQVTYTLRVAPAQLTPSFTNNALVEADDGFGVVSDASDNGLNPNTNNGSGGFDDPTPFSLPTGPGARSIEFDGNDTIFGGEGKDTILGGTGDDILDGGDGDDSIFAESGEDTVDAGDGNDELFGGDGADTLNGGLGDDLIFGASNPLLLEVDDGASDTLNGDGGNDTLLGGAGDDVLNGGDGDDQLGGVSGIIPTPTGEFTVSEAGDDIFNGGDGDDFLGGGAGNDTLNGGEGDDVIDGDSGDDQIFGGLGSDTLSGADGVDVINGGEGDDDIHGGQDDDELIGGLGNDTLDGGFGNDEVLGGAGDDTLIGDGSRGRFIISNTEPVDGTVYAVSVLPTGTALPATIGELRGPLQIVGPGDTITTGPLEAEAFDIIVVDALVFYDLDSLERDTLITSITPGVIVTTTGVQITPQANTVLEIVAGGTATFESVIASELSDGDDTLSAGAGNDVIDANGGDDTVNGGGGDDLAFGGDGNDTLVGADGDDTLEGEQGNDAILGGSGDDTLNGGDGDDFLAGALGQDSINGGAGEDINSFQGVTPGIIATISGDGSGTAETVGLAGEDETFVNIEILSGSETDDILTVVGSLDAVIRGLGGDDVIQGSVGSDRLAGNDGNDTIRGGGGDDFVFGNAGNDILNGGAGDDQISGNAGDDFLIGLTGIDTIITPT